MITLYKFFNLHNWINKSYFFMFLECAGYNWCKLCIWGRPGWSGSWKLSSKIKSTCLPVTWQHDCSKHYPEQVCATMSATGSRHDYCKFEIIELRTSKHWSRALGLEFISYDYFITLYSNAQNCQTKNKQNTYMYSEHRKRTKQDNNWIW